MSPEARHVVDVARRCRDAGMAVVRHGAELGTLAPPSRNWPTWRGGRV
ncbi:hypothetical protein [Stigmatella hybrida]